jgi:hypothetical protein
MAINLRSTITHPRCHKGNVMKCHVNLFQTLCNRSHVNTHNVRQRSSSHSWQSQEVSWITLAHESAVTEAYKNSVSLACSNHRSAEMTISARMSFISHKIIHYLMQWYSIPMYLMGSACSSTATELVYVTLFRPLNQ